MQPIVSQHGEQKSGMIGEEAGIYLSETIRITSCEEDGPDS
jgi:hypothetical protein